MSLHLSPLCLPCLYYVNDVVSSAFGQHPPSRYPESWKLHLDTQQSKPELPLDGKSVQNQENMVLGYILGPSCGFLGGPWGSKCAPVSKKNNNNANHPRCGVMCVFNVVWSCFLFNSVFGRLSDTIFNGFGDDFVCCFNCFFCWIFEGASDSPVKIVLSPTRVPYFWSLAF